MIRVLSWFALCHCDRMLQLEEIKGLFGSHESTQGGQGINLKQLVTSQTRAERECGLIVLNPSLHLNTQDPNTGTGLPTLIKTMKTVPPETCLQARLISVPH